MTYGSADSDNFGFDPNTGRPTSYTATVNGNKLNAIITNNTNGTIQGLNVVDQFFASNSQTCSSSYDDLGRLITYNCGTVWSAAYSYDAFGNMMKSGSTSFMPTYNLSNQFQLIPSGHPSYDNNGNLLNDSFHTYAWDAEGHPVTIDTGSFVYDALGRRVEFGSGSSFTQYFYAAFDPHYNLGNAVAFSGGIRIPVPGGGQATANSGGVYGYRHPNWQGSQMVSSTTTRTVAADSSFSPYGERYSINGYSGFFAGMLMQYPFFTDGYQADARLFEDYAGRWISPDPAGLGAVDVTNPQTLNRYVYVGDDPLNHVDPSGLYVVQAGACFYNAIDYATMGGPKDGTDYYLIGCNSASSIPNPAPIRGGGGGAGRSKNGKNVFACASEAANKVSIAGALQRFGIGTSGVGKFVTEALGGNAFSSAADLIGSFGSGENIAYNFGQGLAAGPSQGFGAAFGKSIEGTPWASGPVDVATGAIVTKFMSVATGSRTLQTLNGAVKLGSVLGEGAEYATGFGELKLAYDAATYFGSLVGCGTGLIR